jgi:hypothetical protein
MIIFNGLAAGMVLLGMACGYAVQALIGPVGHDNFLALAVGMGLAAALDVAYRWRNPEGKGLSRFVLPWSGGHLMLLPLWAMALILIGIGASKEMEPATHPQSVSCQDANDTFVSASRREAILTTGPLAGNGA